jgi:23S rRNA (adenine-N6)-dimethyltransferase
MSELRFTQNFLHSKALVDRIVKLARIAPGSTVLEIGPGKGIITTKLAEQVGKEGHVVAVELDTDLAKRLREQFSQTPQVEIVNADILQYPLQTLPQLYSVFSNVPFNITSALLEHLFNPPSAPQNAHLILQTDSLINQGETFKSLMLKPLYTVEQVYTFARTDFSPQPKVETGLFAFEKRPEPLINPPQYDLYKNFLAFVSKDRVGEGVWRKVFSANQLTRMGEDTALVYGRGLKSQSIEGIVAAFQVFVAGAKRQLVNGAMAKLREEQARREQINREGGHRR